MGDVVAIGQGRAATARLLAAQVGQWIVVALDPCFDVAERLTVTNQQAAACNPPQGMDTEKTGSVPANVVISS